jgi:hypothetical protein
LVGVSFGPGKQVHEVAGSVAIRFDHENHVEVRGGVQQIQQRPQCEALSRVAFETEIDPHMLHAGLLRSRGQCGNVRGAEVAPQEIVEIHAAWLAKRVNNASRCRRFEHERENLTFAGVRDEQRLCVPSVTCWWWEAA